MDVNSDGYSFKITLIGNSDTGKTELAAKARGYFPTSENSSISIETDYGVVNLHVWDTAAIERFPSISSMYFRGASALLFCFDLSNSKSFYDLQKYIQIVDNEIDDKTIHKYLICILRNQRSTISLKRIQYFAEENNLIFVYTILNNQRTIQYLFKGIATKLISPNTNYFVLDDPLISFSKYIEISNKIISNGCDICLELQKSFDSQIVSKYSELMTKQNKNIDDFQQYIEYYTFYYSLLKYK